ncbi:MAG: outer membrane beta-barrel family protein [Bacteroidota bacterium]
MRLPLLVGIIVFLLPLTSFAQRITGSVVDSTGMALPGATVMLLQAEDSVLANFVLADKEGSFKMYGIKPNSYILQTSFIGYAKNEKIITVEEGQKVIDMEPIVLRPEDVSLDQVNIEGETTPILFNKDTVEYNADAFGVQQGEVVEDLLRKLPGVKVDEEGNVEAQGRQVNKVLVDGKEFFTNDPKLATKNLPADAVKKVQVFDEKSDQEEVTGVDDGQVNQTINLELKEDKKKGAFGTLEAGYGTDERYQLKGNINRFSPNLQISALGLGNNVNEDGFSVSEYIDFMGGLSSFMDGSGGVTLEIGPKNAIPIAGYNDGGISTTQAGGLNANFDLGKKTRLTTSYFHTGISRRQEQISSREQVLGEDFFLSENEYFQTNQFYNNSLRASLRFRGDSISRFRMNATAAWRNGENFDTTMTRTFGAENNLENSTDRLIEADRNSTDLQLDASYLTRIKKKGRTISIRGNVSSSVNNQLSNLNSLNSLFPQGVETTDTLQQEQTSVGDNLTFGGKIEYTEPLAGTKHIMRAVYEVSNYNENQDQEFFDLYPERIFNTALSNNFRKDYLYQRGGLSYTYNGEKATFQAGLNGQNSTLQGLLFSFDDTIQQNFNVLLPSMRYNYRFGQGKRLGLNYNASFDEPSIRQLQPVVDNRNPFSIYQGNPNLKPEYTHNLRGDFVYFDQFSFTKFFTYFNLAYVQNPIVESTEIDSLFRQFRTPVNVDNALRGNLNANFGTPIRPLKIEINIGNRLSLNRGINFINQQENVVNRITNQVSLGIENRKKKVWDGEIGAKLGVNLANYSEATELNRSFFNQEYFGRFRINFLENWRFRTNFNYTIYAGGNFGERVDVPLLRASLSRQIFNKKITLEVEAFDILNQNKQIERRAELNFIQDSQNLTLTRYFMFKVSYAIGNGKRKGGVFIDKR